MNLIFWKNEAVEAGGCLCNKMSMGLATVAHNWLDLHTAASQHSGSWQSISPSVCRDGERKKWNIQKIELKLTRYVRIVV